LAESNEKGLEQVLNSLVRRVMKARNVPDRLVYVDDASSYDSIRSRLGAAISRIGKINPEQLEDDVSAVALFAAYKVYEFSPEIYNSSSYERICSFVDVLEQFAERNGGDSGRGDVQDLFQRASSIFNGRYNNPNNHIQPLVNAVKIISGKDLPEDVERRAKQYIQRAQDVQEELQVIPEELAAAALYRALGECSGIPNALQPENVMPIMTTYGNTTSTSLAEIGKSLPPLSHLIQQATDRSGETIAV